MIRIAAVLFASLAAAACGGSQNPDTTEPGDTHGGENAAGDLDVDGKQPAEGTEPDSGEGTEPPPGPSAAYTIVLKNTHDEELVFNMDNGWAANILMFSGKPPKAVRILPFALHCTAGCDAEEADRCPVCPKLEKLQDIKKAQKLERVPAGETLEVPWDGQVHVYQKVKKKCQCFAREPAPAGQYTVRVCGLRLTKSAKASTQLQCVDVQMSMPAAGPRIEVEFPKPAKTR